MKENYFKKHGSEKFHHRNKRLIKDMTRDVEFKNLSKKWVVKSLEYEYTHHFTWLGRPIIQLPQDIIALQEIIWKVKPEVIVETGIARGGSLIFYASMLHLIGIKGDVIGIDIALREHNRKEILKHPFGKNIVIIDGSSVEKKIVDKVYELVNNRRALVVLDSNHSHTHVLQELLLYNKLVEKGSYLIALDTWLEDFPSGFFPNRPWDKGNNAATAVSDFLKNNKRFENDQNLVDKLALTCNPTGYLKCIKK